MDQHPVPQNISSYEFRLVGDMTLKQFLQLAGGGFVGLIFYRLPLPILIKWPLIALSIFIGIMLAFIPVQGRPFSAWLLAFIRAVYTPTEFYWEQKNITPLPPLNLRGGVRQDGGDTEGNSRGEVFEMVIKKLKTLFPKPPIINTIPFPKSNTPSIISPYIGGDTSQGEVVKTPPIIESQPLPEVQPATPTDLVPSPESANILSGLVYDSDGKIVEGAIVEIINSESGMPVRALRSNKLGQFTIATPLTSGKYAILTEKDGLVFDPVSIEVTNAIIKSILLKAK